MKKKEIRRRRLSKIAAEARVIELAKKLRVKLGG